MSLLFYIVAFQVYILCVHIWTHMVRNVLIGTIDQYSNLSRHLTGQEPVGCQEHPDCPERLETPFW